MTLVGIHLFRHIFPLLRPQPLLPPPECIPILDAALSDLLVGLSIPRLVEVSLECILLTTLVVVGSVQLLLGRNSGVFGRKHFLISDPSVGCLDCLHAYGALETVDHVLHETVLLLLVQHLLLHPLNLLVLQHQSTVHVILLLSLP